MLYPSSQLKCSVRLLLIVLFSMVRVVSCLRLFRLRFDLLYSRECCSQLWSKQQVHGWKLPLPLPARFPLMMLRVITLRNPQVYSASAVIYRIARDSAVLHGKRGFAFYLYSLRHYSRD